MKPNPNAVRDIVFIGGLFKSMLLCGRNTERAEKEDMEESILFDWSWYRLVSSVISSSDYWFLEPTFPERSSLIVSCCTRHGFQLLLENWLLNFLGLEITWLSASHDILGLAYLYGCLSTCAITWHSPVNRIEFVIHARCGGMVAQWKCAPYRILYAIHPLISVGSLPYSFGPHTKVENASNNRAWNQKRKTNRINKQNRKVNVSSYSRVRKQTVASGFISVLLYFRI